MQVPIKKKLPFTYGCDPEFALFDINNNMFVSAHDLIPGTKHAPHKVPGGAIQVDGVMVEFNIDPASTPAEFTDNISKVMAALEEYIPKSKYKYVFDPIVVFDKAYFDTLPDSVKELGCSPDFNAWKGGGINQSPEPVPFLPTMRTCSGHIHIGWTQDADISDPGHLWDCRTIIRALDCYLADRLDNIDKDRIRRLMYGKLGAFRPKPYGVEWRVPSNFWMADTTKQNCMIRSVMSVVESINMYPIQIPSEYKPINSHLSSYLIDLTPNASSTRVAIGARIAPTSGRVNYDLNLDVPEATGGRYSRPPNNGAGLQDYVLV